MKPRKKPEAPQQIVNAFKDGLKNFVRNDSPDREKLRSAAPAAFPIYTVTLEDLKKENLNAQLVGWRLLYGGPAALERVEPTLADVATTGRHSEPKLVKFTQLAPAAEFFTHFEKILKAEQLIRTERRFELRFLRIPGLTLDAFWLRSPDGVSDVFVPIRGPAKLEPRQYSLDEFLRTLQPLVEIFQEFDKKIV